MKNIRFIAAAVLAAAVPFVSATGFAQQAEALARTVSVETLHAGEGDPPPAGSYVLVDYVGTLADGTRFDAAERTPLDLNAVVPGFAQGLMQMRRGGHYRMTIPSELGYGNRAVGPIPANSDLIFEVALIDFKTPEDLAALYAEYQKQQEAAARARIEAAQAEQGDAAASSETPVPNSGD